MVPVQRLELQAWLEEILGSEEVHFQPNEETVLVYPAIVYSEEPGFQAHADNTVYRSMRRYEVTLIDPDPDNPVKDVLFNRLYCSPSRNFVAEGLNHYVYDLYH